MRSYQLRIIWVKEPFTEKEFKNALECMVRNRAPGPDGVPY
jgi:hypothetical protein